MKILIDIDELEKNGTISTQLAMVLRENALPSTGSISINILLAFGAIATAAGLLALLPSRFFSAFLGVLFIILGYFIKKRYTEHWGKLARIWMIIGALVLSASVGIITNNPFVTPFIATLILTGVSIIAESGLLIALVPLTLIAMIGGSTGYWVSSYSIIVGEPTIAILLFTTLAYVSWRLEKQRNAILQHLAIIFSRVCIILVNFAFWIGSMFGDTPGDLWDTINMLNYYTHPSNPYIHSIVFIISWAISLIIVGIYGARHNNRFLVNLVAVFVPIHFYTQWFEHIGFHAASVIVVGVATIAFGLGLWRYNKKALSD